MADETRRCCLRRRSDREDHAAAAIAFIRRLYLAGVKDPKRLTFKGLQALAHS